MSDKELSQKAVKDFNNNTGDTAEDVKTLHAGRQNTVFLVTGKSGEQYISRYRTAKEFWYESVIKEKYLAQMGVKNIPEIVFAEDEEMPQLLIYKYIEGDLLHKTGLKPGEERKLASIISDFHISANSASNFMDFVNGVRSETSCAEDFVSSLDEEARACELEDSSVKRLCSKAESLMAGIDEKDFVLVHNDFHFKNILRESKTGNLVVIDWDSSIIAPREKDFVKLLDWSHENDRVVPDIMKHYEDITQYKLNPEIIELYRAYAALRQIHFQTISNKQGVAKEVLQQEGFFAGNEENMQRLNKALEKLDL